MSLNSGREIGEAWRHGGDLNVKMRLMRSMVRRNTASMAGSTGGMSDGTARSRLGERFRVAHARPE